MLKYGLFCSERGPKKRFIFLENAHDCIFKILAFVFDSKERFQKNETICRDKKPNGGGLPGSFNLAWIQQSADR